MECVQKYFSGFSAQQLSQFAALGDLYQEWNSKINVISRKDIDALYEKHVLHSLSIAATYDFPNGSELIDIGTGGGFPGIPLAIYFPQVKFHLVDSIAKKLKVVDAVVNALELTNVTTEHKRVENLGRRTFDFAVSRAVAPLKDLWQWSRPMLRQASRGGLICLKGGDLAQEISESGTRPRVVSIADIFPETYFVEKYLLFVAL
jgi:16S rRNA (guanine527-N7)-methyltransferase